jgi:CPA1 family monovalent cation:H+ antiporter
MGDTGKKPDGDGFFEMALSAPVLVFWALLALAVFAIVSRLLHKPYPIVMLIGGGLLALIPGLKPIIFPPDLVFLVMLPLLLFGGGWTTDFRQFKAFLGPILWLALGLVAVTTVALALLAHFWMGLPLASAFVLGAILSPSDAIATEAIAEEIAFPQGAEAILSGESLVNDAAALVIYAFAIEAVLRGSFSLPFAVVDFFYVSVAGIAIGIAVCALMYVVTRMTQRAGIDDDVLAVLLSLVTPFMAYLPAQAAQSSGVLAAVAGGVFLSSKSGELFTPDQRIAATGVWGTVTFVLNGLAFILIGLQLRSVIAELTSDGWTHLLAYALGTAAVIVSVRIALVTIGASIRWRVRKSRGDDVGDAPPWGDIFITAWSGMRGIVTLAGALAIPLTTASGAPFPGRALIFVPRVHDDRSHFGGTGSHAAVLRSPVRKQGRRLTRS